MHRLPARSRKRFVVRKIFQGKKLLNYRPLTETHPELTAQWDAKRNGNLKPSDIGIGSPRLVSVVTLGLDTYGLVTPIL
jgi:hypothetical protein